jgi:hypothetical protein
MQFDRKIDRQAAAHGLVPDKSVKTRLRGVVLKLQVSSTGCHAYICIEESRAKRWQTVEED